MRGLINVLLVEDCEDDFMLFGEMLRSIEHVAIDVNWARTYEAGLDALAMPHDVGFVDYRLGARDGLNLIEAILGRGHRAPVIILTGQGDHEVDVRAMRVGASDYLVKGEMTASLLERSMRYAIDHKRSEVWRKDSERKLEHSVSLLKATLESTADGILVTDRVGEIVNLNQRFKALWRLPEAAGFAEIGRGLVTLLDQLKDPEAYTARVLQLRTQPEAEGADIIEFKDGRVFERHPRPQWSKGEIVGTVWSFRDITEQRHMQTTLAASDRLASMGALTAGIAHEINNPLAYVIANLSVLADELPALAVGAGGGRLKDLTQILGDAREGADRVRRVVSDLKVFSRVDDIATGPVELRPLLEFAANMAFHEIRHRARLVKDYGIDVPSVEGNEGKLGQVFLNLLVNAAHSIQEGRVGQNEIRIVTRTDSIGRAVVEIHDTGEGISADTLSEIFRPFFTTKPIGVGTGLGLSISRSIVIALGGSMDVKSEVGKGSVFSVVLPAAGRLPASVRPPSIHGGLAPRRGQVLVVDDDAKVAAGVSRVLREEHDVVVATSGRAALEHLLSGQRVDVILCDLMMPEMTGMDFHEEVSRVAPMDAAKIVFLTGGAVTSSARAFLEATSNERLPKPFDILAMRKLVRRRVAAC